MDHTSNQRSFPPAGASLHRCGERASTPLSDSESSRICERELLSLSPCFRSSNLCLVAHHYASSWVRLPRSSVNCELHKLKSLHRHKRCQDSKPCQCDKQSLWLQINKQEIEAGSCGLYHVGGEGEIVIFQKGMVNWPRIEGEEVESQS